MAGTIRWLGHAFVEFTTGDGHVVLFDPWTKDDGNPAATIGNNDIEKADLVLVSHDHFDHVGSAAAVCSKTGALLGGPVQTVQRFINEKLIKEEQGVNFGFGYMVGGGVEFDWVKVISTPAFHSSDTACALGNIVTAADGTRLYHAGDTSLFSEMALYARLYPIDMAFLPIGGTFTMDAYQACEAVKMIKPKMVIPIHYASFPIIAQNADEFVRLCEEQAPDVKVIVPEVGETIEI